MKSDRSAHSVSGGDQQLVCSAAHFFSQSLSWLGTRSRCSANSSRRSSSTPINLLLLQVCVFVLLPLVIEHRVQDCHSWFLSDSSDCFGLATLTLSVRGSGMPPPPGGQCSICDGVADVNVLEYEGCTPELVSQYALSVLKREVRKCWFFL